MLQGQARGKVGDLVFYVRDGGQQTRVRNRQPSNPRTMAQMYQRVKLASVVNFYKRQASLFRFALKKSQKESYYNAFVRYNINLSPYFTREQAAENLSVPAPYIIADGDLPRVAITDADNSQGSSLTLVTDLKASWNTWADVRNGLGLSMGMMFSLIIFIAAEDNRDQTKRIVLQHVFTADTDNMRIGDDILGTEWSRSSTPWRVTIDAEYFGINEFFATGSCAVISSNNGSVKCSFAQLYLDDTARGIYNEWRTEEQRELASQSYGQQSEAILDPRHAAPNLAEFTPLYEDAAFTTPAKSISLVGTTPKTLYYKPGTMPVPEFARFYYNNALFEEIGVTPSDDDKIIIKSTDSEMIIDGAAGEIRYYGETSNIIGASMITLSLTQA